MTAIGRSLSAASLHESGDVADVEGAAFAFVEASRLANEHIALAVSGGSDSMVMLHAVALAWSRVARTRHAAPRVLTFDHGTGEQARAATELVKREAELLGFDVRVGRASLAAANEAEWRAARWRFFREESPRGARVATAHTRDDQIETVVMRAMRAAGPRGLAGLAAPSGGVVRPFLGLSRSTLRAYGNTRGVSFVEDPTNASRDHLRNRVRLDLLPAIDRVRPRFAAEMLALSERAAALRAEVDAVALRFVSEDVEAGVVRVAREELATYDSATLCVLWPAIAARAAVTLDRRGTLRLAQFTTSGAPGARMQLSGAVEVFRDRESFVVRRLAPVAAFVGEVPLSGVVQFGDWRFRPVTAVESRSSQSSDETPDASQHVHSEDPWISDLPSDRPLVVRSWRPADRMRPGEGRAARRVKRFFGDARIPGPSRAGWPVVLVDDEIVWIPGVRRSGAASERSGRPVVRYTCERGARGHTSR